MLSPEKIPTATSDQLSPVLLRLLECPTSLLPDLASQCAAAISDLPDDSRPETYEGLIDVARFCVEEDPGWETERRAQFIGGHPRIGAPLNAPAGELSDESRKEQMKGGQADLATLERLARLNSIYEARYPGLRFVTYVAGRSRAAVADELESILGSKLAALSEASNLSNDDVRGPDSEEWQSELDRALDALWDIAVDRATKIVPSNADADSEHEVTPIATAPNTASDSRGSGAVAQDEPFLSLATFRMLVLSSPVLESFFKTDLSESFYLEPVERSQSGGAYAWHTAPNLPGAPRALPGASKESAWTTSEASYSRDVTTGARGKVVGFLGNLLGEEGKAKMNQIADQVGQRLQTHTVTGPRPSFGRNATLDGGKMDTQELRDKEADERKRLAEERKNTLGSRLVNALRPPTKTPSASSVPSSGSTDDIRGRTLARQPSTSSLDQRGGLRGTDLSTAGPEAAADALRAAQEALLQERPAFVIDEVDTHGEVDDGDEEIEEPVDHDLSETVDEATSADEGHGLLQGREAQRAKELRLAPTQ